MNQTKPKPVTGAYQGYQQPHRGSSDELLVRTSRGTACGEYLRRYWQPVAFTSEVEDVPRLIHIMGEDLVLFRDKSGRYGLVHRQCPHRRASMEFGMCDERGIRCCYHGWLFDIDGSVLEVPGQPEGSIDILLDPIHTTFLHSRMSRPQFSEGMAELGEMEFYQREMGFLGSNTRRVGDNIWVRINELVLPNYTQAGAAFSARRERNSGM